MLAICFNKNGAAILRFNDTKCHSSYQRLVGSSRQAKCSSLFGHTGAPVPFAHRPSNPTTTTAAPTTVRDTNSCSWPRFFPKLFVQKRKKLHSSYQRFRLDNHNVFYNKTFSYFFFFFYKSDNNNQVKQMLKQHVPLPKPFQPSLPSFKIHVYSEL